VVHVSSAEAYPPRSPYGGGKACQDIICDTYQDVPVTVVVTQSLFGERQQPEKLIPTAIRTLLNGQPVKLQSSGASFARRPFMHVANLADALVTLAERPHDAHRRYHVGATSSWSVLHVVETLAGALNVPAHIESVPVGGRVGHELTVPALVNDIPGWEITYPLEEALRAVARWYQPEWQVAA
jgi:nucleoside-diphosphate-sugar epimerase